MCFCLVNGKHSVTIATRPAIQYCHPINTIPKKVTIIMLQLTSHDYSLKLYKLNDTPNFHITCTSLVHNHCNTLPPQTYILPRHHNQVLLQSINYLINTDQYHLLLLILFVSLLVTNSNAVSCGACPLIQPLKGFGLSCLSLRLNSLRYL